MLSFLGVGGKPSTHPSWGGVEFWHSPERCGWLLKQGEYLTAWRRRWFVMKQGKIFWFKSDVVTPDTSPRGVIDVNKCLSIKGAEDSINKPNSFEISTMESSQFFIADSDKEKEDWINSIGRAIVKHSKSLLDNDRGDYTSS
ncbi:MAG: hypothetical protein WDW38_005036 [Sanguina aurantia]